VLLNLKPIRFDWDKANKHKNKTKHNVDFKECEQIFFNNQLKTFIDTKHSQQESRFIALGKTDEQRKLTIVFTIRNKKIRIISARPQSKKEAKIYEK